MKQLTSPEADSVKAARLKAGLTQADAASLIGLATRTWRYYETGERKMRPTDWTVWKDMIAERATKPAKKKDEYGPQERPRRR